MKLLPANITPEMLESSDIEIQKAIKILAKNVKYNTRLTDFLDMTYDWQKKAMEMTKDHKVVGLICGNQMGKSETACALLACHAIGVYPKWYEGKKYSKPVKIMVAGVDSNHNKNVLQEKLFGTNNRRLNSELGSGMIPRESIIQDSIVTTRGDEINSCKIKHISGGMSEIIFRAYSQGREAAQGFQADVICIDEQPNDEFWSESLVRTAATGGHVICTFTPLKGLTALIEELMSLEPTKDSPEDKFGKKYRSEAGWAMVRASWDDIEHIDEDTKQQLIKGFAAYERDARTFGMPIAGHGRIFPYQENDITYDPREVQILDSWSHLIGIDLGHTIDPSAVILCAYDEVKDIVYITDEKQADTPTTKDMSRLITSVNHTVPVVWPKDANRSSMSAHSTVSEQLRDMQVNLLGKPFLNPRDAEGKRNDRKAPGIAHINERFQEGKLKISTSCPILLKEIEGYQYTEQGKIQDGKDHCIDACRYAVMSIIQNLGEPLNNKGWDHYEDNNKEFYWNSY